MGLYDTFVDGSVAVQIKYTNNGDSMPTYNVGDEITIEDCVLIGYEGVVVIQDNKVVMVTENLMDKWGRLLDCVEVIDKDNPIRRVIDTLDLDDIYSDDTELTVFTDLDGEDFLDYDEDMYYKE